jgi:hypothetical protein
VVCCCRCVFASPRLAIRRAFSLLHCAGHARGERLGCTCDTGLALSNDMHNDVASAPNENTSVPRSGLFLFGLGACMSTACFTARWRKHLAEDMVVLADEEMPVLLAPPKGGDPDWPAFNSRMKKNCSIWVQSHPGARLLISAMVSQVSDALMGELLHRSGEQYQVENATRTLLGNDHLFRVLTAHRNVAEYDTCRKLIGLLGSEQWSFLPMHMRTFRNRSLATRLIIRELSGVWMLLISTHIGLPFKLFSLLDNPSSENSEEILRTPQCMRDPFSKEIFKRYLTTVADTAKLDTASIECGHSLWQREARCRSLQTIATSQSSTSAALVMTKRRPIHFAS